MSGDSQGAQFERSSVININKCLWQSVLYFWLAIQGVWRPGKRPVPPEDGEDVQANFGENTSGSFAELW